ncbi:MAG: lanthanide-dependent methanol dehydrogenase, partial [Methylobacteriaceae bacterium]|nr:lanthanide-dependent methanol dehydrogenase [Methylobacteriaceae bacterium]
MLQKIRWIALIAAPLCAMASLASAQDEAGKPVPPPFAAAPEDGQWTMPAKNVASTRYSGLDEITTDNAKNLKVAFTFSLGYNKGQEAAPLVIDNTMYIVSSYPNVLYALDLTKPGAPLKWKYEPKPSPASQGVACCDVVNRGAAYANGKLFFNTLDDFTIAVDAKTGKEAWRTKMGDINKGETMTMAPLVMKDKVFVGDSGGEMGVRGCAEVLDQNSVKIVWRAYTSGNDADVLIGAVFNPFYVSDKGKDLGVS